MKLRLSVPLRADETPMSFVSRLAARNGARNAHSFCLDWGLRFQDVVNGNQQALNEVAALAGVGADRLAANAFVQTDKAAEGRSDIVPALSIRRSYT